MLRPLSILNVLSHEQFTSYHRYSSWNATRVLTNLSFFFRPYISRNSRSCALCHHLSSSLSHCDLSIFVINNCTYTPHNISQNKFMLTVINLPSSPSLSSFSLFYVLLLSVFHEKDKRICMRFYLLFETLLL